jgi:RHS repeat-associated protein
MTRRGVGYNGVTGELTSVGGRGFGYDAEGRMKWSTLNGVTTEYGYDGEGRRVRRGSVVFVYDAAGELAAEYGGAGGDGLRYVAVDGLGSTRVVLRANGTVAERYDYYPFGDMIAAGVNGRTVEMGYGLGEVGSVVAQRFTGKERDGETGLDYFGARYYSGAQGRWASPDQINVTSDRLISPSNTLNKYVYAANNPLKYTDPDGRDITISYWPGAPTGHITLAAYNQDTKDFAYLSVGPQRHQDPKALSNPVGGVPGTTGYVFPQTVDELRQNYAALTTQTSPEVAQEAIDAIRSGAGTGNWALFGNNCTSSVANVLREVGIWPGNPGLVWQPRLLWSNLFRLYANPATTNLSRGYARGDVFYSVVERDQPGTDYGYPRFGVNTFDWLIRTMQAPLKACVTVTDSASGTNSTECR